MVSLSDIVVASTTVMIACKLQSEYLAKVSPQLSASEWEEHFKSEARKLIHSMPAEQLDQYLQERFPDKH